jgi:hypothetical protein
VYSFLLQRHLILFVVVCRPLSRYLPKEERHGILWEMLSRISNLPFNLMHYVHCRKLGGLT